MNTRDHRAWLEAHLLSSFAIFDAGAGFLWQQSHKDVVDSLVLSPGVDAEAYVAFESSLALGVGAASVLLAVNRVLGFLCVDLDFELVALAYLGLEAAAVPLDLEAFGKSEHLSAESVVLTLRAKEPAQCVTLAPLLLVLRPGGLELARFHEFHPVGDLHRKAEFLISLSLHKS